MFSAAGETIRAGLDHHSRDSGLMLESAQLAMAKRDWVSAIERFEALCSVATGSKKAFLVEKLHQARAGKAADVAETAYSAFREGRNADSVAAMSTALDALDLHRSKPEWLAAYSELIAGKSAAEAGSDPVVDEGPVPFPSSRKILVAGTGWSGSSAVYDFLREFLVIEPVKGELRHIEGKYGFRSFVDKKNPSEERMFDFFTFSLLGLRRVENLTQAKAVASAWSFLLPDNVEYARAVKWLMRRFHASNYRSVTDGVNHVAAFIDRMLASKLVLASADEQEKVLLLDNVIHAWNVSCLRFVENYAYVAVFRDPRAQYVARVRENPLFHADVEMFITDYRHRREVFEKRAKRIRRINKKAGRKNIVHALQFEEFVLSDACRAQLRALLDLDGTTQEEGVFFRPDLSRRNVYLHRDFEDQKTIAYIGEALKEYCWED